MMFVAFASLIAGQLHRIVTGAVSRGRLFLRLGGLTGARQAHACHRQVPVPGSPIPGKSRFFKVKAMVRVRVRGLALERQVP